MASNNNSMTPADGGAAVKMTRARVPHTCAGGSWTASCGRQIKVGEQYHSFHRGGLHTFSVCADCARLVQP